MKQELSAKNNDIIHLDAVDLMEQLHGGGLSCAEVMQAFLQRIEECNPAHNALVAMEDPEQLMAQARTMDDSGTAPQAHQLLYGMPQAPKDLLPVAGMPSTRGSLLFKDEIPQEDTELFARMRAAGALFVGRSNTPEFGLGAHTYNPVYGITRNAWDTAVSAGGSSGGAAVAIARHMLPVADGSDMMGSLRTPAAFNGVYGLRTTPGLVPNGVPNPLVSPSLSVAGPMARNIPDLAMLLAVMAGFPAQLPFGATPKAQAFRDPLARDFKGVRVGWLGSLNGLLAFDEGVLEACESVLPLLADLGCHIEPHVPDFDYRELWQSWLDLRSALFYDNNNAVLSVKENLERIKPEAQWEYIRGTELKPEQFETAKDIRRRWLDQLDQTYAQFEFLLMPTAQVFPFAAESHWPAQVGGRRMDTYHRWMEAVVPASMGGAPTISIPVRGRNIRPGAGVQIFARPGADLAVMQLAHAYDLATRT
ncbi:MAG: amidase [Castellaniella sp.]